MLLIVTRPAVQAAGWMRALQALGQPAQALPLIGIAPVADAAPLRAAWAGLNGFALAMFVSANAVDGFFAAGSTDAEADADAEAQDEAEDDAHADADDDVDADANADVDANATTHRARWPADSAIPRARRPAEATTPRARRPADGATPRARRPVDGAPPRAAPRWPAGVLAGSTGPGTSAALRAAGVPAEALVEPGPDALRFDSEALWAQLAHRPWAGRRALIVRGEGGGRDWLAQTLRDHGAAVQFLTAYRRVLPALDSAAQALLQRAQADPAAHAWLFSASEAVANLRTLAPQADWSAGRAVATHPRIAAAARAAGFGRVDEVPAATPQAVAEALGASRRAQDPPLQSGPQ